MKESIEKIKSIYRVEKMKMERLYNSIFGGYNYKKFIVIASGRTGSNLLISYLNSHPNIEAKGELFRDLEGRSCIETWNRFFYKKPRQIKMAGFKLFYYHPFHTEDRSVWDIVTNDKNIKIIHLVRVNKLRSYLSLEIANKTDMWSKKRNKNVSIDSKKVKINFKDFLERIEKIENYELETSRKFKNHNFLEISYEDLVENKEDTMRKVFNIINLKENEFKSNYKKQNKEKISDLILNYDEFIDELENSKYAYLKDWKDN